MKVLYRLTSINSINKIRPVELDKQGLIELCLNSFIEGFKSINPTVHFIIDKPTVELADACDSIPFEHTIETLQTDDWNSGNLASFYRQIDLAKEADDEVFFLEDDYYFLPNAGEEMEKALRIYDFVSPYHHPSIIPLGSVKDGWQLIPSTTLTFATHPQLITDDFKKYGWADEPMWKEITDKYTLVQPVPSLATHMETPYLATSVDWSFV
jgi:hypothetical protein